MGYYKILVRFLEKKGDKSYFRIFIVSAIGPEDAILLLLRMFPALSGIDNVSFEYILRIELSSKDSDIKEAIENNGYFASGKVYYNEKERDKLLLLFPYFCVPAQKLSDKNLNRIHIGYKKKRLDNGLIEFQGNIKLKDIEKLFFDFLQTIIKTNILTFIIASDVKKKEDATKRFIVSKKKLFIFLKNNFGDIITNGHLGFGIVDESKNIELYH